MPSRAVLRKKARRETKRQRAAESADAGTTPVCYNGNDAQNVTPPMRRQRTESDGNRHFTRERGFSRNDNSVRQPNPSDVTIVPERFQVPPPQKRETKKKQLPLLRKADPPPLSAAPSEEVVRDGGEEEDAEHTAVEAEQSPRTHKQRKKLEAKLRLEKQMARLQENAARAAAATPTPTPQDGEDKEGQGEDGDESKDVEVPVAEEGPRPRHDPRFTNGTFWRDRKERRARTLFLGGVPSRYTVQHVKDLVSTVVDTDPGAVDYIAQLTPGTALVEEVDMLPDKHGGKVRHMYVTMASVPIAFIASTKLDNMRIEQRFLRCNFAADKSQRAEAIHRRGPEVARGRGGMSGGGRGFRRGAPRGGGRGTFGMSSSENAPSE